MFVSENAKYIYLIIYKKQIISGCSVVLADFEHLNLAQILRANSLEFFVSIKEHLYPVIVLVFYANLSFRENFIQLGLRTPILTFR